MGVKYLDEKPVSSGVKYVEPDKKPLDKYQQAAADERARLLAAGAVLPEGYTRRLTQGLGMNWTDEAMAGLMTVPEMIKRGVNPAEAYRYARARELGSLEAARENTGALGSAVEVLGGLGTGARAVIGALPAAGRTAIQQAPGAWNAVGRYAGNVGKGAVLGGVSGAGDGTDLASRGVGAALGGAFGAGAAVVLPAALKAAGYLAQPITNQIRRLASRSQTSPFSNVDDIATGHVAETMRRSGKTRAQVEQELADANAAGQPYVLADAIGTEGQRRLAAIAKSPGTARQWIDEDLGQRDLGRSLRVQDTINQGLGIPRGQTAEMAAERLTREAQARSRPFYRAAEARQPNWTPRMQEFFDHPDFGRALREGFHIERGRALAEGRPFNPRDYAITQFNEAGDPIMTAVPNMRTIDLMKRGIDELINKHRNPLTGRVDPQNTQAMTLDAMRRAFLREVDSVNPMYARARQAYAGPAQVRTAVERGRDLPLAGRPEDTIPRMARLPETDLQGTRIGVADRISEQLMKGTETGPLPAYLRNPKGRQELDYLSLHQGPRQPIPANPMARASDPVRFQPDPMRRALEREATMRQTYTQARGGSQTAENVGDMLDTAVPPQVDVVGVVGNVLAGRPMAAAQAALPAAARIRRGETEAQREAMARILMARDAPEVSLTMQRIDDLAARQAAAAQAQAGASGVAGGTIVANPPELRRIYIQGGEYQ
jgi:hypothetical protein